MSDHRFEQTLNARKNGYGIGLYRSRKKDVAGVCGGIAECFSLDRGLVQIAFVVGFFLSGTLTFWLYIIGCVMIVPKPKLFERKQQQREEGVDKTETVSRRVKRAKRRMKDIAQRVEEMEGYVTSRRYNLDRQFSDLDK